MKNVKWAQFITGGFGPPPKDSQGRRLFEKRVSLPQAYESFGKSVDGLNSILAGYLSSGNEKWKEPLSGALSALETSIPMAGPFILGSNALRHYKNGKSMQLATDALSTGTGRGFVSRTALLSLLAANRVTRPFATRFMKMFSR